MTLRLHGTIPEEAAKVWNGGKVSTGSDSLPPKCAHAPDPLGVNRALTHQRIISMNFIRNHQEHIIIALVVVVPVVMAVAFAPGLRSGQEWAFAHHSVREVLAAAMRGQ